MYFNCSFPRNFTAEQDCCNFEAGTALGPLDFSADNSTAHCATRNGSALTACLAQQHSVFASECLVLEVPRNETSVKASSSPRRQSLSLTAMVLVAMTGLTCLVGVSAADSNSTTCKEFEPVAREHWTAGLSEAVQVSHTLDCRQSNNPCSFEPAYQPVWRVTWSAPEGIEVKADAKELLDALGDNWAEAVQLPVIYDTMWLPTMGYLTASVQTTIAPGTFRQCDDGKAYNGSAAIPRSNAFSLKAVEDLHPKGDLGSITAPASAL